MSSMVIECNDVEICAFGLEPQSIFSHSNGLHRTHRLEVKICLLYDLRGTLVRPSEETRLFYQLHDASSQAMGS